VLVWLPALVHQRTYDDPRRLRSDQLLIRLCRAAIVGTLLLLGVLFLSQHSAFLSRTLVVAFSAASVATTFLSRLALHRMVQSGALRIEPTQVLIVGTAAESAQLSSALRRHNQWGLRIMGQISLDEPPVPVSGLPLLGGLGDIHRVLEVQAVDQVFLTSRRLDPALLSTVAGSCDELGVSFTMDANFLGLSTSRATLEDVDGWSALTFSSVPTDADALLVKRAMDIVLSSLALLALSPVFLGVALVIKAQDRGPVLFAQERSGLNGRRFHMLKFRSMVVDAEARKKELEHLNEMSGPVFKIARDPRITAFGQFIRKTSIDELPQFWNVLVGDMSLVGPRPPIPAEVERYERWQLRRLSMKPGITCIWQVSGRNNVDFETWIRQDLEYIDNWSLFLDVKLLLRTVPVVLLGTGAR
jgi:exopolysaccharide biosynthesis polyprenyl glycosylphosphotransferase